MEGYKEVMGIGGKGSTKIMLENDIMKPNTLYTNLELQVPLKVSIFFTL